MKTQVSQTVIKCDGCGQIITYPLSYQPDKKTWCSIKDMELCEICSMNILEDLVRIHDIKSEELDKVLEEYQMSYRCPKEGISL